MDSAISIRNVTKMFGAQAVLSDMSFEIPKGKITTILGFSGAGKSTLLKHILGLLHPTSGKVFILGQDLSLLDDVGLREFRKNFGMLFQYAALFDSFSTFENVAFPLREFTTMNEAEIKSRVTDLLTAVSIKEESFYKVPSQLSGGMRKRVGLARALALKPAVMLYDEPTTGLDPITTHKVNDLIVETAHKNVGMTSVIISHDIRATLKISDYIAFLDRGKIVEYASASDFKRSANPLVREFLEL